MQLVLTPAEGKILIRHLTHQADHLDDELVHTDKRELQRALAQLDVERCTGDCQDARQDLKELKPSAVPEKIMVEARRNGPDENLGSIEARP